MRTFAWITALYIVFLHPEKKHTERVPSNNPELISVPDAARRPLDDALRGRSAASSREGLWPRRAAPATPHKHQRLPQHEAGQRAAGTLPHAGALRAAQVGPCCSDMRAGVLSREGATPLRGHVGTVPTRVCAVHAHRTAPPCFLCHRAPRAGAEPPHDSGPE